MLLPSNAKSADNSRMQHNYPNSSDTNNVTDSSSNVVNSRKGIQMKIPLPPQHRSSLLMLAPSTNQRVNLTLDEAIIYELKHGRKVDPKMDNKQVRRIISNRISAQRSEMRRSQYITNMEKMVRDYEAQISVFKLQIERYNKQRKLLQLKNESLRKLVELRSNESRAMEMLLEQNRLEIWRLQELPKTTNNNSHEPSFGEDHLPGYLRLNQLSSLPYSIEFYQNGLRKLEANQQPPSSMLVQPMAPAFGVEQQSGFMAERPVEVMAGETRQEEEDIDQYLNFDEIDLHPTASII